MRLVNWKTFLLLLTPLLLMGFAARAADYVVVCPVNGVIDDGEAVLIDRAVHEASEAKALILDVDTPGGQIDSALKISKAILNAPCRTIAFIEGMGAISAGALISYSCSDMIMAPEAAIGAATPVIASPEGMLPTGEKEVSFMRAKMRALAERYQRNPAIAEAMVDKDIELWSYTDSQGKLQIIPVFPSSISEQGGAATGSVMSQAGVFPSFPNSLPIIPPLKGGRGMFRERVAQVSGAQGNIPMPPFKGGTRAAPANLPPNAQLIKPAGKLLTLTPQEAIQYGLITATAASLQDAMAHYSLSGVEVRRLEMTWAEIMFRWLTNPMVAGLLLMFGIGGLYLEMKTPGVSLPGIVGVICLVLFFGSHLLVGVAHLPDILLVVIGIALILGEIFVLPGHMVMGVSGVICILLGLYLALTGVTVPHYSWEYARIRNAGISFGVAFTALAVFVYATWKLLPHTPFYSKIVQVHIEEPNKGYVVQTDADEAAAIGREGVAATMLRPAGRGRFGATTYPVVSRGEYIPVGSPIIIVQVDGNRYVVERKADASS